MVTNAIQKHKAEEGMDSGGMERVLVQNTVVMEDLWGGGSGGHLSREMKRSMGGSHARS